MLLETRTIKIIAYGKERLFTATAYSEEHMARRAKEEVPGFEKVVSPDNVPTTGDNKGFVFTAHPKNGTTMKAIKNGFEFSSRERENGM